MQIDPEFAALCPPLSGDELRNLRASLVEDGCREPLILWDGVIIDGHNRYRICTEEHIAFDVTEREFDSREHARWWIARNQIGRRNLSAFARTELALEMEPWLREKARAAQAHGTTAPGRTLPLNSAEASDPVSTRDETARIANVGTDTVRKVRSLKEIAERGGTTDRRSGKFTPVPKAAQAVAKVAVERARTGEMSINAAAKSVQRVLDADAADADPGPAYDAFQAWLRQSASAYRALGAFRSAIGDDLETIHRWSSSDLDCALNEAVRMRETYSDLVAYLESATAEVVV